MSILNISMDEELKERVVAEAQRTNQPVSWWCRSVLAKALAAPAPSKRKAPKARP